MSDTVTTDHAAGHTTGQKVAAEALGTFVLVFIGTTAAVLTNGDLVAIALAFGLALMLGVYCFGRVSGAHLNPAVSVGAALSGRMSWRQVPVYVGAQLGGAILASGLLWTLLQALPDTIRPDGLMGQNFFGGPQGFAWWGALLAEIVGTAILVSVILGTTDARNEHPAVGPLVIGLTLAAIHLALIPLTATSVNPARSIAPALFAGTEALQDVWLFVVGPLVGAAIAGLAYPAIFGHGSEPVPGSGLNLSRPAGAGDGAQPGYRAPDQFQQEWNQQEQWAQASYDQGAYDQGAYTQEPIIQDGWQWDHQAQEWKPLEQWASPEAQASAPSEQSTGHSSTDTAARPVDQTLGGDPLTSDPVVDPASPTGGVPRPGPDGDGDGTRIRP